MKESPSPVRVFPKRLSLIHAPKQTVHPSAPRPGASQKKPRPNCRWTLRRRGFQAMPERSAPRARLAKAKSSCSWAPASLLGCAFGKDGTGKSGNDGSEVDEM